MEGERQGDWSALWVIFQWAIRGEDRVVVVALVGLETGVDHRSTGNLDSVASPGVQALLALEVETGKAASAAEYSRTDCSNGQGESDLGARPCRFGTISEAGDLRLATNGAGILALGAGSTMPKNILTTLADVRPQSRAIDRRL